MRKKQQEIQYRPLAFLTLFPSSSKARVQYPREQSKVKKTSRVDIKDAMPLWGKIHPKELPELLKTPDINVECVLKKIEAKRKDNYKLDAREQTNLKEQIAAINKYKKDQQIVAINKLKQIEAKFKDNYTLNATEQNNNSNTLSYQPRVQPQTISNNVNNFDNNHISTQQNSNCNNLSYQSQPQMINAQNVNNMNNISTQQKMSTLYAWLLQIQLTEYYTTFKQHGYEDIKFMNDLMDLNAKNLNEMGIIKMAHKNRILKQIEKDKQQKTDASNENEHTIFPLSTPFSIRFANQSPDQSSTCAQLCNLCSNIYGGMCVCTNDTTMPPNKKQKLNNQQSNPIFPSLRAPKPDRRHCSVAIHAPEHTSVNDEQIETRSDNERKG